MIKNKTFLSLWVAMFVSTAGSMFMLLGLSINVFKTTGSSTDAGLVFAAQWISPIVFYYLTAKLSNYGNTKKRLILIELTQVIPTLLVSVFWESYYLALLLLLFRGFGESTLRSLRIVALKRSLPQEIIEQATSAFNMAQFIGHGFGALLGSLLISKFSMVEIALLDSSTFIISSLIYIALSKVQVMNKPIGNKKFFSLKTIESIKKTPELVYLIAHFVIIIALVQGFHNIARTVIPAAHFNQAEGGIQMIQFVFTLAVTLGALFVVYTLSKGGSKYYNSSIFLIISTLCPLLVLLMPSFYLGIVFYFLFAFLFEVSFTRLQASIVKRSSKDDIGNIFSFVQMLASGATVMCIYIFGKITDSKGITLSSVILFLVAILTALIIEVNQRKSKVLSLEPSLE